MIHEGGETRLPVPLFIYRLEHLLWRVSHRRQRRGNRAGGSPDQPPHTVTGSVQRGERAGKCRSLRAAAFENNVELSHSILLWLCPSDCPMIVCAAGAVRLRRDAEAEGH